MEKEKTYIAIDLKSFYASQECIQRGLDPLRTHLVVADSSRTEKTICLAVTPSLKKLGVSGRARLFEALQQVQQVNALRRAKLPGGQFAGKSWDAEELANHPEWEVDFIIAPPQMSLYMECSARIYEIYLRYVAPEDIHVYSIDEVFIDATPYLKTYGLTGEGFARKLIYEVLETTGITATAGIGTNLYLCKVAMDIVAKKMEPDRYGVRIAKLDEISYRRQLWDHRSLTDFWRVGPGYTRKLEKNGLFTMGDVARCSLGGPRDYHNPDLLYRLFGVQAELLIDHAWGIEPCTMKSIKAYRPQTNSLCSGQVLHCAYTWEKARLIVKEMTEQLMLDLVEKALVTDQLVLTVGYDRESLDRPAIHYTGPVVRDHYGRQVPRHAHGTAHLPQKCASARLARQAILELYDKITDPALLVRRINLTAAHVIPEREAAAEMQMEQLDLFAPETSDPGQELQREQRRQQAVVRIRRKFGKNAIIKGMDLEEGATTMERNGQVGGHKA